MRKKQIYQLSALVVAGIISVGCMSEKDEVPKPQVQKPSVVVNSGITLSNLKSSGVATVSLKGSKSYKQGSAIEFEIDTKGKAGYLYIIYLDNKGNTGLLYPNEKSPLAELSGKYIFPRDFGNTNINASKDCGDCKEEKTTVYALLSKEPITDIKSITKSQLVSFTGTASSQPKGIDMTIGSDSVSNTNLDVGRLEFIVQ